MNKSRLKRIGRGIRAKLRVLLSPAMLLYILKRLLRSLLTLILIMTIVFCLSRLMPVEGYYKNADKMTPEMKQAVRDQLGLDDNIFVQLGNFYGRLLRGDLGTSYVYRQNKPVWDILKDKLPISIRLGSMAIVLSMILGIPMGTLMARFKNKIPDHMGTGFIVLIQAVPMVVFCLFIKLFGYQWLGLKATQLFSNWTWEYWILPVITLSLGNTAYYAMWIRRYMVDEGNKDYVSLARIKGAGEGRIMFRHIFRNAFVPMVQYIPSSFLNTVVGSIYVEAYFSVPGMGGLLVDVIKKQDNAMILGIVLIYACVGIIGLILGDLLMVLLDPRISLAKKRGGAA